jgi:Mn2+/Fe2+ NRAMP family transporter
VIGPGLMVMLADTDAGSVITASQSGARWGYRLLALQLLLIPVLYAVMQLVVRVAITTGKGQAELIREHFGGRAAAVAVTALVITALGALVTELAGIAGAGALFGLPRVVSVTLAAALLLTLVFSGGYRRAEIIGILLGLFELAFVVAAVVARPSLHDVAAGALGHQPLTNSSYLLLIAANIGAVVMPWMLFYQQGAIVQKRLAARDLRAARIDTAVGAVLTQLIMIAVLAVSATTLHGRAHGSLQSVGAISHALAPFLGATTSRITFALGIAGAAMVASIVVTLATAWAVAEALGKPRALGASVREQPLFHTFYAGAICLSVAIVLASSSLIRLAVDAEVLNAILLPLVLCFLVIVAHRTLPRPIVQRRWRRTLVIAAALVIAGGFLPLMLG